MDTNSPLIIGFGSRARVGKDHACRVIQSRYPDTFRIAFADQLKANLRSLLTPLGLDPFTTDPKIKEMIRPTLVAVGMLAREVNPDFWVRQVFRTIERRMEQPDPPRLFVLPDARFKNEIQAIKAHGGYYVEIEVESRPYVNDEEARNSPQCAVLADFIITNFYHPDLPDDPDPGFDSRVLGLVKGLLAAREEPVPYDPPSI